MWPMASLVINCTHDIGPNHQLRLLYTDLHNFRSPSKLHAYAYRTIGIKMTGLTNKTDDELRNNSQCLV